MSSEVENIELKGKEKNNTDKLNLSGQTARQPISHVFLTIYKHPMHRKLLSKTLFTLHQKIINVCRLKTCTGEEFTPLFTTLHPLFTRSRFRKICKNLWNLWDVKKVVSAPDRTGRASDSIPCAIRRWRVVKRGEEWASLFTSRTPPSVYRGFSRFGEEWRVKRRVVLFYKKTPDVSFCAWQWQIIALVRGNVVP